MWVVFSFGELNMIVHTHKSPGYTPRVMQTVTSNVYDKAQPLLIGSVQFPLLQPALYARRSLQQ
jgi:hypothetical protein